MRFSVSFLHNSNFMKICSIGVQKFLEANQVRLFVGDCHPLVSWTEIRLREHLQDCFLSLCCDQQLYQQEDLNCFCLLPSLISELQELALFVQVQQHPFMQLIHQILGQLVRSLNQTQHHFQMYCAHQLILYVTLSLIPKEIFMILSLILPLQQVIYFELLKLKLI